jgi:O-antigen ligase
VLLLAPIAVVALFLSLSATAFVSAFAGIAFGIVLYFGMGGRIRGIRVRPGLGIPILLMAFLGGFLIVGFGWTSILEALGRDATLTGRTKLWSWAASINEPRQWLGSGYRAFWIDENTLYFSEVFYWGADIDGNRSDNNRGPDHAHSGYMDTYLDLGYLGVTALALLICSSLVLIRRRLAKGSYALSLMFSVLLCFLLVYAVTEQSILQQSEDLWFLFSMFYLFMVKEGLFAAGRASGLRDPFATDRMGRSWAS